MGPFPRYLPDGGGDLGKHQGFYPNHIHTKFATRLTPESATYMGKGKPYEDTVISPWMYLRISGCILL